MLYLPPKAKRKIKEIAFYEDRKEHDVYVEAVRDYLEKRGHHGLL
jgi:predicted transcriptional regulator